MWIQIFDGEARGEVDGLYDILEKALGEEPTQEQFFDLKISIEMAIEKELLSRGLKLTSS